MKNGKDLMIQDLKERIRKLELENQELKHLELSFAELQKQLEDVRSEKAGLEQRLTESINLQSQISEERNRIQYCLDETRKSFSYRLGYRLTTLPRKMRALMKKGE